MSVFKENAATVRQVVTADFDGDLLEEILAYNPADKGWWLGKHGSGKMHWAFAGKAEDWAPVREGSVVCTGFFSDKHRKQIAFYEENDKSWWLAVLEKGNRLQWRFAGHFPLPAPSGTLSNFLTGDFDGDGYSEILFYDKTGGNWWLYGYDGRRFTGRSVSRTPALNLPSDQALLRVGRFSSASREEVMWYDASQKRWWLGTWRAGVVHWSIAFGNAIHQESSSQTPQLWQGDFDGDGYDELLCYSRDKKWWMGGYSGRDFGWHLVSDTTSLDLPGYLNVFHTGRFTSGRRDQVLWYRTQDHTWWTGTYSGLQLRWTFSGHAGDFEMFSDGKTWKGRFVHPGHDVLMCCPPGTGDWWLSGNKDRESRWFFAGNTDHCETVPNTGVGMRIFLNES